MSNDLKVLDRSVLISSLGDDRELIEEILELFRTAADDILDTLRISVIDGDLESVKKSAHSLKGSAGNIGAYALEESIREVETSCSDGNLKYIMRRIEDAVREYNRLKPELSEF